MQSFDAAALAHAYREGALRPADVVEDALARIARRGDDGVWIELRGARRPARRGARPRAAARRGRAAAALRPAVRGQGQHRRRRAADDGGVPRVRVPRRRARARGGEAGRGGRAGRRQDQPRPVRDRPGRRALALRRAEEPVRRALHRRRLQLAARASRSRRGWSASRSAPTRPARGVCRRRSTTSSASSRAAACSARPASSPLAARSTAFRSSR